jgi:hypothetical protein
MSLAKSNEPKDKQNKGNAPKVRITKALAGTPLKAGFSDRSSDAPPKYTFSDPYLSLWQ